VGVLTRKRSSSFDSLVNCEIAAGEIAAGRVTVAQMNREEIVIAGITVISHVD
jgi:hypothetical protein